MNIYNACARNYNEFKMSRDEYGAPMYVEIPKNLSIFDGYKEYVQNVPETVSRVHFMDWTTFEGMPDYNLRDALDPSKLYVTNFMYLSAFNAFYNETIESQVNRVEVQYTAAKNVLPSYIRHRRILTLEELEAILHPEKVKSAPSFEPSAEVSRIMRSGGIVEYVCDEPRLIYEEDIDLHPKTPGVNTRAIVAFGAFMPCIIGGLSITELQSDKFKQPTCGDTIHGNINVDNCRLLADIIHKYESSISQFGYVDHRNIFKRYDGTEIDAPENLRNASGYEGIWVIPLTHLNYELLLERLLTPAYYLYSGARPSAEVIDALNTL